MIVILALTLPLGRSPLGPSTVFSDSDEGLWVASSRNLVKLGLVSGTALLEIPQSGAVRLLAIDEGRSILWTWDGKSLQAFNAAGSPLRSVPLPSGSSGDALVVNPVNGHVWLGAGKTLYHLDAQGRRQPNVALDKTLVDFDIDPATSRLWVATKGTVKAYDTTGAAIAGITLPIGNQEPQALAVDRSTGEVWIALGPLLRRYTPGGIQRLQVNVAPLKMLADDGHGGVWGSAGARLFRIDGGGAVLVHVKPFSAGDDDQGDENDDDAALKALESDRTNQTVWVGGGSAVSHVASNGSVLLRRSIATPVRDLALQRGPNQPPIVNAGPDQAIQPGATATLDGTVTDDGLPGGPLTITWTKQSGPGTVTFGNANLVDTTASFSASGTYVLRLSANDGLATAFDEATVTVTAQNQPPVVSAGPDRTVVVTALPANAALTGLATDDNLPAPPHLVVTWTKVSGPGGVNFANANAASTSATFSLAGVYTLRLTANDGALSQSDEVIITVQLNQRPVVNAGPDLSITLLASAALNGSATDDGLPAPANLIVTWTKVDGPGTVIFTNASVASTTARFSARGTYTLRLTADDGQLSASDTAIVEVDAGIPPDPSTVAPALSRTQTTDIGSATAFLYTGPNPIQTGVAPGTIDLKRAAVLRGKVLGAAGAPLPGVMITILNHPEFGQTLSRADGMFDMAVNGGGPLTVNYQKTGLLPAQRQVNVPWQDFVIVPDVALIPLDTQVTSINLTAGVMQVARGTAMTDVDGTRQATLLFPPGTTASMVLPGGSTQPLTAMHVRATEYTVGSSGPTAMPAQLPAGIAYTYAVDFSVDEALAAGAREVDFTPAIPFYLENFLNFPVGVNVPQGTYDMTRGTWVAGDNGRVVKILGITGGRADLDTTGNGTADQGVALG